MIALVVLTAALFILTPDYAGIYREVRMDRTIKETTSLVEWMRAQSGTSTTSAFPVAVATCYINSTNNVWALASAAINVDAVNPYSATMTMAGCNSGAATLTQTVDAADGDFIAARIPNTSHNGSGVLTTRILKPVDQNLISQFAIRRDAATTAMSAGIDMGGNDIIDVSTGSPTSTTSDSVQHLIANNYYVNAIYERNAATPFTFNIGTAETQAVVGTPGGQVRLTAPDLTLDSGTNALTLRGGTESTLGVLGELRIAPAGEVQIYHPGGAARGLSQTSHPIYIENPLVVDTGSGRTYRVMDEAPGAWFKRRVTLTTGNWSDVSTTTRCNRTNSGDWPTPVVSVTSKSTSGIAAGAVPLPNDGPRYYIPVFKNGTAINGIETRVYGVAVVRSAGADPSATCGYYNPPGTTTHPTCYLDKVVLDLVCPGA